MRITSSLCHSASFLAAIDKRLHWENKLACSWFLAGGLPCAIDVAQQKMALLRRTCLDLLLGSRFMQRFARGETSLNLSLNCGLCTERLPAGRHVVMTSPWVVTVPRGFPTRTAVARTLVDRCATLLSIHRWLSLKPSRLKYDYIPAASVNLAQNPVALESSALVHC